MTSIEQRIVLNSMDRLRMGKIEMRDVTYLDVPLAIILRLSNESFNIVQLHRKRVLPPSLYAKKPYTIKTTGVEPAF